MSAFKEAMAWIRETVTRSRVAYGVGIVVSGAMGHCVAIASVEPRVDKVEADLVNTKAEIAAGLADLRDELNADRWTMHRMDGMLEAIAAGIGVPIPPARNNVEENNHER